MPFLLAKYFLVLMVAITTPSQHVHANDLESRSQPSAGPHTYPGPRDRFSLSHPSPVLDINSRLDFKVGKAIFEKLWVFAPSSTTASDGLGPLYNARSCARCHEGNGKARLRDSGVFLAPPGLIIKLLPADDSLVDAGDWQGDPLYGGQLQTFAYPGGKAEAAIKVRYTERVLTLDDDSQVTLFRPEYQLDELSHGSLAPTTRISPRLAPALIGMGLLDAIEETDILSWEDPTDQDQNGISGRANRISIANDPQRSIGRFGWKAGSPSLDDQNTKALNTDIGIGSWRYPNPYGDCSSQQTDCLAQAHGNTDLQDNLEASRTMTDLLLHYVQHLAVPARSDTESEDVKAGQALFDQIGCAQCHRPSYTIGHESTVSVAPYHIWPYSDLLLHDMGEALADGAKEHQASGREWRTAPLWGLGAIQAVSKQLRLMHDGRARSIPEAILWHGGEARSSRDAFMNLSEPQRNTLLKFLETL